jgi:uncharacterized membrane protein YqjE
MNVPPGSEAPFPEPPHADGTPANWREAILLLARTRLEIIRLELGDVLRSGARKAVLLAIALFALVSAWLLVLAGGVGAIAALAQWPWYWVALAAAALHLAAAGACVALAARKGPEAFPVTRSEFQRDRECIERKISRPSNA